MTLAAQIRSATADALKHLFPDAALDTVLITVNQTKPEFTGDYTIVLFPFVKALKIKPDALGKQLGDYLIEKTDIFSAYEIVSGFLNLTIPDKYWVSFLLNHFNDPHFGEQPKHDRRVMVEYSSPNTNKPLHFGHLRNNFLGYALSGILKANGSQVIKANLVNDRGIHICKSMIAWIKYANEATPDSTGLKGDHLVGDYYVKFNDVLNEEIKPDLERCLAGGDIPHYVRNLNLQAIEQYIGSYIFAERELRKHSLNLMITHSDNPSIVSASKGEMKWKDVLKEDHSKEMQAMLQPHISYQSEMDTARSEIKEILSVYAPIMKEAQELLRRWEAGDKDVRQLWQMMNGWVYKGFDETYRRLGIDFDKMYYESDTYLLGKQIVEDGLQKGVLFKKEDGSVWIDLTDEGLDQKLLLRADGTSVYMTQDLGTAKLKYDEYKLDQSIYVIGDEQNYHMQVLKLILKKMGEPCADGIYHLSYGMVELPSGRMKSREGNVVDADDMITEMVSLSKEQAEQAGKTEGFSQEELDRLYETIGIGALKFYLLRVEPKKKMIFDPKESIDLHGFTATFIQYAHARICSILRKENIALLPDSTKFQSFCLAQPVLPAEKKLILALEQYPLILQDAATEYNPSALCNYSFQLAQLFNTFYDEHSIAKAENEEKKQLRLMVIIMTAQVLRHAMNLLGIKLPERM